LGGVTTLSPAFIEVIASLGVAIAAGFLVGAERERTVGGTFAGARTFPLIALSGAVGALLGTWVLVALAIAVGILFGLAYFRTTSLEADLGMSTEVAAVVTFGLGALCTTDRFDMPLSERLLVAAGVATATLALLSIKEPLHGFIARISKDELYATVKLLLLAVILLPILPDENLGPWATLNPLTIGLLVVLIAAIGFVGYVAIRVLGERRGVGLTGLLGGLASSTAVTFTFAGRAGQNRGVVPTCAVAIVLASAMMFPRVLVEVYAVSPELTWRALWPFVGTTVIALTAGAFMYSGVPREGKGRGSAPALQLQNPFSLSSAFKFAALFVAVLMISGGAAHYFHNPGVYFSAAVAGLADSDSVALSAARMFRAGTIDRDVAVNAIGLACVMNTLSKVGIAAVLGGPRLGVRVGATLAFALLVGTVIRFTVP
jgi:uncharacterized membrane protein (DUF4010 family)